MKHAVAVAAVCLAVHRVSAFSPGAVGRGRPPHVCAGRAARGTGAVGGGGGGAPTGARVGSASRLRARTALGSSRTEPGHTASRGSSRSKRTNGRSVVGGSVSSSSSSSSTTSLASSGGSSADRARQMSKRTRSNTVQGNLVKNRANVESPPYKSKQQSQQPQAQQPTFITERGPEVRYVPNESGGGRKNPYSKNERSVRPGAPVVHSSNIKDRDMTKYRKMKGAPLLSRAEEIVLGRLIVVGIRHHETKVMREGELERPLSDEEAASMEGISLETYRRDMRRSVLAKERMVASNLRLVRSIGRRYRFSGLSMHDIVQEGTFGLVRACEKFDPERGFRFSTYSSWWIKQSMMRAIADQSRVVRLPVHVHDFLNSARKANRAILCQEGREASDLELAEHLNMPESRVQFYRKAGLDALSFETPSGGGAGKVGSGAGSTAAKGETLTLSDTLNDGDQAPEGTAQLGMLQEGVKKMLHTLSPREQEVVSLRYGLDTGEAKTLEEIGQCFSVTRERVRQIEARAMHKLRQPFRNHNLRGHIPNKNGLPGRVQPQPMHIQHQQQQQQRLAQKLEEGGVEISSCDPKELATSATALVPVGGGVRSSDALELEIDMELELDDFYS